VPLDLAPSLEMTILSFVLHCLDRVARTTHRSMNGTGFNPYLLPSSLMYYSPTDSCLFTLCQLS
jgi:hypothetical protein